MRLLLLTMTAVQLWRGKTYADLVLFVDWFRIERSRHPLLFHLLIAVQLVCAGLLLWAGVA